jgi:small redox-active disulfide protein 2
MDIKKEDRAMEIKILGPGCANCHKMEEMAKAAVKELGIEAIIEKVSDIQEIMKYTMSTPGLVVNGKLKCSGKPLPDIGKVKTLIREEV